MKQNATLAHELWGGLQKVGIYSITLWYMHHSAKHSSIYLSFDTSMSTINKHSSIYLSFDTSMSTINKHSSIYLSFDTSMSTINKHSSIYLSTINKHSSIYLSTINKHTTHATQREDGYSPVFGALVLMSPCICLKLACSLSPTNCKRTASLVVTMAPLWRKRWNSSNTHQFILIVTSEACTIILLNHLCCSDTDIYRWIIFVAMTLLWHRYTDESSLLLWHCSDTDIRMNHLCFFGTALTQIYGWIIFVSLALLWHRYTDESSLLLWPCTDTDESSLLLWHCSDTDIRMNHLCYYDRALTQIYGWIIFVTMTVHWHRWIIFVTMTLLWHRYTDESSLLLWHCSDTHNAPQWKNSWNHIS